MYNIDEAVNPRGLEFITTIYGDIWVMSTMGFMLIGCIYFIFINNNIVRFNLILMGPFIIMANIYFVLKDYFMFGSIFHKFGDLIITLTVFNLIFAFVTVAGIAGGNCGRSFSGLLDKLLDAGKKY